MCVHMIHGLYIYKSIYMRCVSESRSPTICCGHIKYLWYWQPVVFVLFFCEFMINYAYLLADKIIMIMSFYTLFFLVNYIVKHTSRSHTVSHSVYRFFFYGVPTYNSNLKVNSDKVKCCYANLLKHKTFQKAKRLVNETVL